MLLFLLRMIMMMQETIVRLMMVLRDHSVVELKLDLQSNESLIEEIE